MSTHTLGDGNVIRQLGANSLTPVHVEDKMDSSESQKSSKSRISSSCKYILAGLLAVVGYAKRDEIQSAVGQLGSSTSGTFQELYSAVSSPDPLGGISSMYDRKVFSDHQDEGIVESRKIELERFETLIGAYSTSLHGLASLMGEYNSSPEVPTLQSTVGSAREVVNTFYKVSLERLFYSKNSPDMDEQVKSKHLESTQASVCKEAVALIEQLVTIKDLLPTDRDFFESSLGTMRKGIDSFEHTENTEKTVDVVASTSL